MRWSKALDITLLPVRIGSGAWEGLGRREVVNECRPPLRAVDRETRERTKQEELGAMQDVHGHLDAGIHPTE